MRAFVMRGIDSVGFMDKPVPTDPGANGAIMKSKDDGVIKPLVTY